MARDSCVREKSINYEQSTCVFEEKKKIALSQGKRVHNFAKNSFLTGQIEPKNPPPFLVCFILQREEL